MHRMRSHRLCSIYKADPKIVHKDIVIGNIYRSPQSTLENNSKMYEAINYVCDNYKCKKLFVGDFITSVT